MPMTQWTRRRRPSARDACVAGLRIVGQDRTIRLDGRVTIGRDPGCDIVIDDLTVSARHCTIHLHRSGRCTIVDLGSRNGVYIAPHGPEAGYRQISRASIEPGCFVRIGDIDMITLDDNDLMPIIAQRHSEFVRNAWHACGSISEVVRVVGIPRAMVERAVGATRRLFRRRWPVLTHSGSGSA